MKRVATIAFFVFFIFSLEAFSQEKLKILWIEEFELAEQGDEEILTSRGHDYLYSRLSVICKQLVEQKLLEIQCKMSTARDADGGTSSLKIAAGNQNRSLYDYIILSKYKQISATKQSTKYSVVCELSTGQNSSIGRAAGTIEFFITSEEWERLDEFSIRYVAYQLAERIHADIKLVPFQKEKILIYPIFECDESDPVKFYKSLIQDGLSGIEQRDPQIKIIPDNQNDRATLKAVIKIRQTPDGGHMFLIEMRDREGKLPAWVKPTVIPKNNYGIIEEKLEELKRDILLMNS